MNWMSEVEEVVYYPCVFINFESFRDWLKIKIIENIYTLKERAFFNKLGIKNKIIDFEIKDIDSVLDSILMNSDKYDYILYLFFTSLHDSSIVHDLILNLKKEKKEVVVSFHLKFGKDEDIINDLDSLLNITLQTNYPSRSCD